MPRHNLLQTYLVVPILGGLWDTPKNILEASKRLNHPLPPLRDGVGFKNNQTEAKQETNKKPSSSSVHIPPSLLETMSFLYQ